MTAAKTTRPTLARKVTTKTEANRKAAMDEGLRITIGGEAFEVKVGDISSEVEAELRRVAGCGFYALGNQLANDPGIDLITLFVWFARRVRGDDVSPEEVSYTYADMFADDFDMNELDGTQVVEVPEA